MGAEEAKLFELSGALRALKAAERGEGIISAIAPLAKTNPKWQAMIVEMEREFFARAIRHFTPELLRDDAEAAYPLEA